MSEKKSGNYKYSKIREIMVKFLYSKKTPVSVKEIMEYFITTNYKPNKTTIYRELEILLNESVVLEVDFADGKKRYEYAGKFGHHHHLVCNECKNIECFKVKDELKDVEINIGLKTGFLVQKHILEFFGLCSKCQMLN